MLATRLEPVELIGYSARYRADFEELNLQWIRKYFKVELKDLEQTGDPERLIVRPGGEVFFLLEGGRAIGTCAMVRIGEGHAMSWPRWQVREDCPGPGAWASFWMRASDRLGESPGRKGDPDPFQHLARTRDLTL